MVKVEENAETERQQKGNKPITNKKCKRKKSQ